ncbi:MAG: chromate transporter [Clostridia bacterium]|nr:chromate transporter [Clostridia bacterium]
MIYAELLWGFLRVGLFSFGGAYGAIPLIRDVVLSYGWLTDEELTYMIAVSESTPGPIMVNLATYVGSSQAGIMGAILATCAVVIPSFVILLIIISVLKNALKNKNVQAVLKGMKPCIAGIVTATGIYMLLKNALGAEMLTLDVKNICITAILAALLYGVRYIFKKRLSPITLILVSACIGIAVF